MSSPVSTGVLKFGRRGAPSALGHAQLAWSPSGSAARRFPTLCKRYASFRTKLASSQQAASKHPVKSHWGLSRFTIMGHTGRANQLGIMIVVKEAHESKGRNRSERTDRTFSWSHSHQGIQVESSESKPRFKGHRKALLKRQRRKAGKGGRKKTDGRCVARL